MPDLAFRRLLYRGNYGVECSIDFSESLLSARYAGGFREDVIVGSPNGLRKWKLRYSALHKRAFIEDSDNSQVQSREEYIWTFYLESKGGGNIPFILKCPRDGKDYLCIFTDNSLTFSLIDESLRTSGLSLEQTFVKGVNTLEDGSLGVNDNPDVI